MTTALVLMAAALGVARGKQEGCEIFPKNPVVPYGSNLMMFLQAPLRSNCRSKTAFVPSSIFWTLNKRKIDERLYDFNSTYFSVSLHNITVQTGTVECLLNSTTPVVLLGTFIRTYPLVQSPENISCIAKMNLVPPWPIVTCMWDHDEFNTNIEYTVHLKQKEDNICKSWAKNCTFQNDVSVVFGAGLNVSVTAENSFGYQAYSSDVPYNDVWDIVQMDSPENVIAEPVPSGLRVHWMLEEKSWILFDAVECEVRVQEKGSYNKPLVKGVNTSVLSALEVNEVKPCTNYTVSVRSRHTNSVWSTWSREATAISYFNVSSLQFHLWRSQSVLGEEGKRTVHLMWRGVPASCKAFSEYCIFQDSLNVPQCIGPFQNHTFITLDEHQHNITVTAFRNKVRLNKASIDVPAMAKEVNLPPVGNINVFVQHGCVRITWEKPSLPVGGFIVVWNSTAKNHMWQHTRETNFTLMGDNSTLYTVSLTPLYRDGPGKETTLHNCSPAGTLIEMSKVHVTGVGDQHAEIHWLPVLPTQCCVFVLNYTVFYKTNEESESRRVTVGPNQHHVILKGLQANTAYGVHVTANTVTTSFKSMSTLFSTKPSKVFLIVIISCCAALSLLSILFVMIQKKFLSTNIPDPRFSSLSMWHSGSYRRPWSLFALPFGRNREKILPCQVDGEVISVSSESKDEMAPVKIFTEIQNFEASSQTESSPLAASFSENRQLPLVGKEPTIQLVPSVDMQTSEVSSPPPIHSPYSKQTPLSSPVESPTKPLWSETETLLAQKLKNTTYSINYVTLDMFETVKHQTK